MDPDHINAFFDEYLNDGVVFVATTVTGKEITGEWTGHGTDFESGEEDVWLGDTCLAYGDIVKLRVRS
jgi:hypothetical protein